MSYKKELKGALTLLRDAIIKDDEFDGMCLTNLQESLTEVFEIVKIFLKDSKPGYIPRMILDSQTSFVNSTYWWKKGKKEPRIKWLNKQINKL